MEEISIYIHIPFCERKCNYCAFVSYCLNEEKQNEYIKKLIEEISNFKINKIVQTIYIGGGTPSLLSENNIRKIFYALRKNFLIDRDAEITIEVNPNSVTEEKLKLYKDIGINRISIGVQSLNNKTLREIGRLHDKKAAIKSIKLARKYFTNISADLILGLQHEKNVVKYAKKLISLGVKHISCYMLEVHENTKLFSLIQERRYFPLQDEEVVKSYQNLVKFLKRKKFIQYEISNFAICGYESKHNINYWTFGDYKGFGASSHSYIDGYRIENASKLEEYYNGKQIKEKKNSKTEIEERIMLGLRCEYGVSIKDLFELGYDIMENPYFKDYVEKKIIYLNDDIAYLDPKYYSVSDYIIEHLI